MDKFLKMQNEINHSYYCQRFMDYYEEKQYLENMINEIERKLQIIEEIIMNPAKDNKEIRNMIIKTNLLMSLSFLGISAIYDSVTKGKYEEIIAKVFYAFSILKPIIMFPVMYKESKDKRRNYLLSLKFDLEYAKWCSEEKQKNVPSRNSLLNDDEYAELNEAESDSNMKNYSSRVLLKN